MKKDLSYILILTVFLATTQSGFSQTDTITLRERPKIAVFTPLYLDSAFEAGVEYRYGNNFPKFFNPGLEFYEGIQMAIDSLQKEGVSLDVHVYDTRSKKSSAAAVVTSRQFEGTDLIIGHVSANEAKLLAEIAARDNIPFINVNYPNDAGVTNNPNYVVLNSTIDTHFSSLYKFLQRNFATSEIVVFTRKGTQEERLRGYLKQNEQRTSSVPLKMKYVTLENNFSTRDLVKHLDSNISNIALAASLDSRFGQHLAHQLALLNETYSVTLFGMPTWDSYDFTKPEYKNLEIFYSTPFYVPETNKAYISIDSTFRSTYYSRPTDMVFRGFESMYRFSHLLKTHGKNMGSSLSDKRYNVYTDYDIQPVLNPKTMTLDYFENKKIYFLKMVDGIVKAAY